MKFTVICEAISENGLVETRETRGVSLAGVPDAVQYWIGVLDEPCLNGFELSQFYLVPEYKV